MRPGLKILALAVALVCAHALMSGQPPSILAELPLAARGVLALMLLALGLRAFAGVVEKPGLPQAATHRRPGWIDHAAAAATLLSLHFAFLWLLGAAPPLIERLGIAAEPWLRPEQAVKRAEIQAAAAAEANPSGDLLWQDRRSRSLPPRTNLRLGSRPEVFLRFDSPQDAATIIGRSAYLSAFALTKYEEDRWTTQATSPTPLVANNAGLSRFPTPAARIDVRRIVHDVFHGPNPSGQNVLIALQGIEWAEIEPLENFGDGFTMLPAGSASDTGYQYRAASRPLVLADLPGDLPIVAEENVSPDLLDIPQDDRISEFLVAQARGIVGDTPTAANLVALEQWLQNAFDYSLETTNPLGLDPMENFLFAERRGHCEHFAMTGALMMRALGIPSRLAYGWAGGTWYETSQLMVFRSREAHAWTEFWLPDHGWIIMDPTPPGDVHGTRSRIAPPEERPPDPEVEFMDHEETTANVRLDRAALGLFGIFAIPALAMLLLRRRRLARSGALAHAHAPGNHTPGYLGAWSTACPPRQPGETLRQQIRRLETPPPFAIQLLEYHYRVRYHHGGPDPLAERRFERDIRAWQRERETRHSGE